MIYPPPNSSKWNNFLLIIGWGRELLRAPPRVGRHKNKASEKVKITIKCENALRSTMLQSRLSDLMVLAVQAEKMQYHDLKEIVEIFWNSVQQR